jgi:hypothetical protein
MDGDSPYRAWSKLADNTKSETTFWHFAIGVCPRTVKISHIAADETVLHGPQTRYSLCGEVLFHQLPVMQERMKVTKIGFSDTESEDRTD